MSALPGAAPPRCFRDYPAAQRDALAAAVGDFVALFRREFDLDVYLTWGTLLGTVRGGDFIAHDDDVDLAYLSRADSDYAIIEEHELIVRALAEYGFVVRPASRGQMHVNIAAQSDLPGAFDLDVWTSWIRDDRCFHYPDVKGELPATALVPLGTACLRGVTLPVPARPAALLGAFYGDDWRRPDPDYAWFPRYHSDDVFEFLRAPRAPVAVPPWPRRVAGLAVEERDGHFYVSAAGLVEPQRLNATAMLILELCSGENAVADIVLTVQQLYGLAGAPEVAVLDFLAHAASCGLLETGHCGR